MDTEGGYNCLSALPTIIDPTTIARVSTPGVMTHSTTLSTSVTAIGTKTASTASASASTVQSASMLITTVPGSPGDYSGPLPNTEVTIMCSLCMDLSIYALSTII